MSDMMQGAPPQRPQQRPMAPQRPQPGGVANKMSMFNPTDVTAKTSRGDIQSNQTVGQFLQKNFGVTPQDPVQKLFQSIKGQAQNSTALGKMGGPVVAPQQPQGPQQPQRPQPMQRPQAPPQAPGMGGGGMQGLINKMGGR